MSLLFKKGKIGKLELTNRVVMPPMCMYKSDDSGELKPFHMTHYLARAIGQVGLIIVEATAVEPRGRISDRDLGLWSDKQISKHKELNEQAHSYGVKMAVQLAHAGRKSEAKATTPIAPSSLAFSPNAPYKLPTEATLNDIKEIKKLFVDASLRAKEANYDAIELHAAHGYLLFEFLSPLTNQREDKYGGSLENRCSLVLEIAKEMKEKTSLPLIVRISADEWMENSGWDVQDSIYLSNELEKVGVDCIHVSSGGNHAKPDNAPNFVPFYQCDYACEIKKSVKIPVIAVGLITTAKEGEDLLEDKVCDFVAYGRELLRSPNFVFYAAKEFDNKDIIEVSYTRAF